MDMINAGYEAMPHGVQGLRVSVYSERIYGCLPHYHEEYCLFYMVKGTLLFGAGDERFLIREGEAAFVHPNEIYYVLINEKTSAPETFHYYSIVFDASMLGGEDDLCRRMLKNSRVNRHITLSDRAKELLPLMRKWDIEKPEGYELYLKRGLFEILGDIISSGQYVKLSNIKRSGAEKSSDAVNKIVSYIENHYAEQITVEDVARKLGYSESHIHRIFKNATGMGIIKYVNRYRVEQACKELIYTDKKITRIALDNGFEHGKNFSKVFRDCMGMSPTNYRKYAKG